MPNTQSEGEVLFRDTLTKLERFIKIWDSLIIMDHIETTILEGIICTLDLLTDIDVNTSELNAIKELERLATMKQKTALKIREFHSQSDPSLESILQLEPELYDGRIFDKIIDSKIDFIKKVSLSQLVSKDRVETMAALERLNEVQQKLVSKSMNILLELKIRQVVYDSRLEAKSSERAFRMVILLIHCSFLPNLPLHQRSVQPKSWQPRSM